MDITPELRPLTIQERAFVQHYLFGPEPGNATKAALASYDCKTYNAAGSMGRQILSRPHVQAAISRVKQSDVIPASQFWAELKKVIEQDKSWASKVAALRLKAEIDGLVAKSSSKQAQPQLVDQSVMDDLAARIKQMEAEEAR